MQDIQSGPSRVALAVDRAGVKRLRLPVLVREKAGGVRHTVAEVDIGADLPAEFKGTHMSRFVEALGRNFEALDYPGLKQLLLDIRDRLQAKRAYACFRFPFFMEKTSPASGYLSLISYDCTLTGEMTEDDDKPSFMLQTEVPVMTVCPCSKAICSEGAHSQRAMVRITCRFVKFLWLEDLIEISEQAGSSPLYTLLKREDEKHVTEQAFNNPAFVEDVVRHAAESLMQHPQITSFTVEVESFESIHNHSAYARIEKKKNSE